MRETLHTSARHYKLQPDGRQLVSSITSGETETSKQYSLRVLQQPAPLYRLEARPTKVQGFDLKESAHVQMEASAHQQKAAEIKQRVLQLDLANQIAAEYVDEFQKDKSRRDRKHIRKQVSTFVTILMDLEADAHTHAIDSDSILNDPRLNTFRVNLNVLNQLISQTTTSSAADLSSADRNRIVGDAVNKILRLNYSPRQIRDILDTAGVTPEERKKIIKTVLISAPTMAVVNLLLGSLSEAAAGYIGVFSSRDEVMRFLNSLDPAVRNTLAVAAAGVSQMLVYWLTDKKNTMSNDMYEKGFPFVTDPNIVVDHVMSKGVIDNKTRESKWNRWKAHFLYLPNLVDEKWYLSLLAMDYGFTFSLGNMLASGIKAGVIGADVIAIEAKKWFDGRYERKQAEVTHSNGHNGNGKYSLTDIDQRIIGDFIHHINSLEQNAVEAEKKKRAINSGRIFSRRVAVHGV